MRMEAAWGLYPFIAAVPSKELISAPPLLLFEPRFIMASKASISFELVASSFIVSPCIPSLSRDLSSLIRRPILLD